ncbi:MarR family winged helix-turn-helix transcriptional regulator [Paenibacillus pinihumi]|uniref:MarR family winged helix-turn-helix transcriptional regulator n=1 Tax=Paenibacillus pinihumi TaxID=669462 RepID=UPI000419EB23|nr:MarR family transcriptional regulator [Paenibacillus pinihumi]
MRHHELDHSIGFLLGIAERRLIQLFTMRMKQYDLFPEQWAVLHRIRQKDGMIQKEIGEKSQKDKPTTTRILDALEAKGFITKKPGLNDRRSFQVYITDSGIEAADAIRPIEQKVISDVTNVLSDFEYEQLAAMLTKLGKNAAEWIEKEKEQ